MQGREDLCENFYRFNRLQGKLYDGETRLRRRDGSPVWMYSMGGLAEYAVVPATALVALPEDLPLDEAAILGCSVLTAFGAVRHAADLRPGQSVVIVGTGGVGSNIVQLSQAFGANPIIAVDVVEEKLKAAQALGATHTVNATREDVAERVRAITDDRGAHVGFEALGQPHTFAQTIDVVRDGGRAVIVGIAPAGATGTVEITRLVRRGVSLIGSYGARPRADLPAIIDLARRGAIDIRRAVTRTYALDEVATAYDALNKGEIVGRALVSFT